MNDKHLMKVMVITISILVVLTIVVSLWLRFDFYDISTDFSELYFPYPDTLQSSIEIGETQVHRFALENNRDVPVEHNVTYGVTLFELYDKVEDKYSCLRSFRTPIYTTWTNNTVNHPLLGERLDPSYELMQVQPSGPQIIWPTYTMQMRFEPPRGVGQFIIEFVGDQVLYSVNIDEANNVVRFNGNIVHRGVALHDGNNDVELINDNGQLTLELNKDIISLGSVQDHTNGKFRLATKDKYIFLQSYRVFERSRVVVPDDGTVWEYIVDANLLFDRRAAFRAAQEDEIRLLRTVIEQPPEVDCVDEPFYCAYFDLPNDIRFYLNHQNLSRAIERIPIEPNQSNQIFTAEDSVIPWEDYVIEYSHVRLEEGSRGATIVQLGNSYAVMVTRNNSYFMRLEGSRVAIDEIRNPEKQVAFQDDVRIEADPDTITLFINDELVFVKDAPADYTNQQVFFHIKNEFMVVASLGITRLTGDCLPGALCNLIFRMFGQNLVNRRGSNVEPVNVELNAVEDITITQKGEGVIDFKQYNPYIDSTQLVFDRISISSKVNASVYSDFLILDGSYVSGLGYADRNGTALVSAYADARTNTYMMRLYYKDLNVTDVIYDEPFGESRKRTQVRYGEERDVYAYVYEFKRSPHPFLNWTNFTDRAHRFDLSFEDDNVTFSVDNRKLMQIWYPQPDGIFYLDVPYTYVDLENTGITNNGSSRRIGVDYSRCALRPTYNSSQSITTQIEPGSREEFVQRVFIERDFDYAKVFVETQDTLENGSMVPLEVHYWLSRQD